MVKRGRGQCPSIAFTFFVVALIGSLAFLSHYKIQQNLHREVVTLNRLSVSRQMQRIKREINENKHTIVKRGAGSSFVATEPSTSHGTAYVRWGRQDCNGNANLIYSGFAAGSYYTHTGGGANFLCIYDNITYPSGSYSSNTIQFSARIYGVEWQPNGEFDIFDFSDVNSGNMHLRSLSCALCVIKPRTTHIMIPGMHKCPSGWHYEYHGFIMSGKYTDKHSSEYICVDRVPHAVHGSKGQQHGAYLDVVETECQSLPCGPIVHGNELQCVVCSL